MIFCSSSTAMDQCAEWLVQQDETWLNAKAPGNLNTPPFSA